VPLRGVSGELTDESLVDADQYVLRLDVRVDDAAFRMQVVETLEDLNRHDRTGTARRDKARKEKNQSINQCEFRKKETERKVGYLANNGLDVEQRNALVLTAYDELEEVVTEHLKHHADV